MHTVKMVTGAIMAAAAFAIPSSSAVAAPMPDEACGGQIVALFNHFSGAAGASGNPAASAGPGYFLQQDTPDAIRDVREGICP